MSAIKAIIVEDELFNREQLLFKLKNNFPEIHILASCENGAEALEAIRIHRPELVFLDVEMPVMNGFEMLKKSERKDFEIIFITAFDNYAINAIRFSALDYLLKPVQTEELGAAIQRFHIKKKLEDNAAPRIDNFIQNLERQQPKDFKLAIATTEGTFFFKTEEIIRCEGFSNYTQIKLASKKTLMTSKTLKEYEEVLEDHNFIRVHKSHLVNQKYIKGIQAERFLLLEDGSRVEVSKRRFQEVKRILQ